MTWINRVKNLLSDPTKRHLIRFILGFLIVIINYVYLRFALFGYLYNYLSDRTTPIQNIFTILTLFIFALGFMLYLGFTAGSKNKYILLESGLGEKVLMTAYGALFFGFVIIAFALLYLPIFFVISYVVVNCALALLFGLHLGSSQDESKNITLKFIDDTNPRYHLELYQTTDTDYHFKDLAGNEFIIPTGQVREIRYKK